MEWNRIATYRRNHKTICVEQVVVPMQDSTPVEMPTDPDHCHAWQNLFAIAHEHSPPLAILTIEPLGILLADIHGTIKDPRPLKMRSIEVRMADRYGLEPALVLDVLHRFIVQVSDQVPQDISVRSLYKNSALADTELLFFAEGRVYGVVAGVLGSDVVDAGVVVVGTEGVFLGLGCFV
jgi:hypothetical protein